MADLRTAQPSAGACASRLEAVIAQDPGKRGISALAHARRGDLGQAAHSLCSARRVAIITGFFIVPCAAPETDGPLGALAM
jgi:D-glutamate cyclase-like, C-terminal